MVDHSEQAARLMEALGLSVPPVAIAFSDTVPSGIAGFDGVVAAGCAFWQEASTRTFATTAADHGLCSIGVHTHQLSEAPESQALELQAALQAMIGLDYVREDEVAAIPVIEQSARYAIYGPLAEFPMDPEVVLLFAHARQGLVISEAVERVDGGYPAAMGRPACAVIPQVVNQRRAAMSLGCCGARAYLGALSDEVALWALPGSQIDRYSEQIDVLARANRVLSVFHERRQEDVASGKRPTVKESLCRLS